MRVSRCCLLLAALALCIASSCGVAALRHVPRRITPARHASSPVTVAVSDPSWYWSPYNWNVQASSVAGFDTSASNNPGAYFKLAFSGTSFTLLLNLTNTPAQPHMTLRWSVDDAPWANALLPSKEGSVLTLASNLPQGTHTLVLFILNSIQRVDRWNQNFNVVRIAGAQLDGGAALSPFPSLFSARMLVYWDSIGEGVRVNGIGSPASDLTDNDSTRTWVQTLAQSLQVEVGSVCYGAQGWLNDGSFHALFNVNETAEQHAWSRFDSRFSRLDAQGLLQPPPELVVMGHGTNDRAHAAADITAAAQGWLRAISLAAGPHAQIVLTIPFGQFEKEAISQAYVQHQASVFGGKGDPRVHLVDLASWNAQEGLQQLQAGPNKNAEDALHPLAWRSAQLGGILAQAIAEQLQQGEEM